MSLHQQSNVSVVLNRIDRNERIDTVYRQINPRDHKIAGIKLRRVLLKPFDMTGIILYATGYDFTANCQLPATNALTKEKLLLSTIPT